MDKYDLMGRSKDELITLVRELMNKLAEKEALSILNLFFNFTVAYQNLYRAYCTKANFVKIGFCAVSPKYAIIISNVITKIQHEREELL